jgi:hypothetical protein
LETGAGLGLPSAGWMGGCLMAEQELSSSISKNKYRTVENSKSMFISNMLLLLTMECFKNRLIKLRIFIVYKNISKSQQINQKIIYII